MYDQFRIVLPLQRPLILEEGVICDFCSQICTGGPCIQMLCYTRLSPKVQ